MPRQARSVFQALGFWAQQRRQAIKPVLLETNTMLRILSKWYARTPRNKTKWRVCYSNNVFFFAYRHILTQILQVTIPINYKSRKNKSTGNIWLNNMAAQFKLLSVWTQHVGRDGRIGYEDSELPHWMSEERYFLPLSLRLGANTGVADRVHSAPKSSITLWKINKL
jgi:hypothetical protein